MKIIRTPIKWNSEPNKNWLHSKDNIETAEIKVDDLEGPSRTGTVTFTQSEDGGQKQVTVAQKRVTTYHYPLETNYRPIAEFRIGEQTVSSTTEGVAMLTSAPDNPAPMTVTAAPQTDINALAVSQSEVPFEPEGGVFQERFTWTHWDKTRVTLERSTGTTPQAEINSASTRISSVASASASSTWLSATKRGGISAASNDSHDERTGTVVYTYRRKTATVTVTQEGKQESIMYFGVKTTSNLANGHSVEFTVNGGSPEQVPFSATSDNYYVASTSATSNSNVTVSCNISYSMITATPPDLTFAPSGESKTVNVVPLTTSLTANNQTLSGYADLDNYDNFYTIEEHVTTDEYTSRIVSGEGFSISGTSISASANTTESARTGEAEFTRVGDPACTATVKLTQNNVSWFSFNSTVSGSPSSGTVYFYKSPQPDASTGFTSVTYTEDGDLQTASWSASIDTDCISYKVKGFEQSGFISASTGNVEFSGITMELVNGRYHISGAEKDITVSAHGISYDYEKKIDGNEVANPSLTGIISANSEVVFNATATTTNKFTITPASANFWTYNITAETPSGTTVKVEAKPLIPVLSKKSLTLVYTLSGSDKTAQTIFTIPSGATNSIELQNFALSSSTQFGVDTGHLGHIPSGASAYTFAFVPPTRKSRTNISGMDEVQYALLRYKNPSGGGESGWMLFYPYNSGDTPTGSSKLAEYAAQVYIISYGGGQTGVSINDDVWTLGPLMYRASSSGTYREVADFEFLSASSINSNSKTKVEVCQTNSNYPSVCPFTGTSVLSASTEYFTFKDPAHISVSATSGFISPDKKQWVITGQSKGGLPPITSSTHTPPSFFARTEPMRERNHYFSYTTGSNNCDYSDFHANSPNAMAHAFSGTLQTNILDNIRIKVVYYGRYGNQDPDVPATGSTWHVPADSYTVSPINPGDTSSAIYDAETNSYIIYNIDNVVVVQIANHTVVPEIDLEEFKTPI